MRLKTRMKSISTIVLRIGIGLVIIWFGLQQIKDPSAWVIYLPEWIDDIKTVSEANFVSLNGWFELVFGTLLVTGLYQRVVAFVLSVHMLLIVLSVGYNEIGVRDFGIFVALLTLFLHGKNN